MHYKDYDKIFIREIETKNWEKYQEYKKSINKELKIDRFVINKNRLLELFDLKTYIFFQTFCFEKIKEWIYWNETYTEKYINKLESILKNYRLINKLNSYEIEYLNHVNAVVFNKKRNLKRLVVDFPLFNKKEFVCFSFSNVTIFKKNNQNGQLEKEIINCELYFSNQRLIINLPAYIYSIHFKNVHTYKLENDLFKLDIFNRHSNDYLTHYYFDTDDNYVLYISFQRIFNQFEI